MEETESTYGMIGKITAKPGQRDALVEALAGGISTAYDPMPGCLLYQIDLDAKDPDAIWVHESWTNRAAHAASLDLPVVKAAIAKGRPLIAGFEQIAETVPVGDALTMM